jgi:uncharacterized protein YbjT (DUF2867 family)
MLLERGHRVRAGTRDRSSPPARDLAALGAEVVAFDFDDPASIEEAARGADAVFASGTAHRAGPEGEVRHGRNLADALGAGAVGHLVYTSGAGADRDTGVPVFEGKRQVEEQMRHRALPATILAPVYLMENVLNPWNVPALAEGVFPSPVPPERAIQQIPIVDIAAFAVHALEHRDGFLGERIEIASDSVTGFEEARIMSSVSGRELEVREVSLAGGLQVLFDWLDRVGFTVDISRSLCRAAFSLLQGRCARSAGSSRTESLTSARDPNFAGSPPRGRISGDTAKCDRATAFQSLMVC